MFEVGDNINQNKFSKLVSIDHGEMNIKSVDGSIKPIRIVSIGKIILNTEKDIQNSIGDIESINNLRQILEYKMSYLNIFTLALE